MTSKELRDWMNEYFEPKKCPFCGSDNLFLRVIGGKDGFRDRFCVLCDYDDGGCGAEGGWRHSPAEALDVWNQRRRKKK